MIALPGLLLATGRTEECRQVLMAWAGYQLNGLLPNRFPDEGEAPQHGAADASLWMIHAAAEYARETGDNEFVDRLFPVLGRVIDHYLLGTEFGISVDRRDGLLRAGIAGQQVTWMDAKVGDLVVTPRIGKPVELNALWYNALSTLANWAVQLGKPSDVYVHAAEVCAKAFNERFWYKSGGYLFDVVDGPDGDDLALRPNQLLALSLPYKVLEQDRWRSVLDVVSRELLTPMGLRTLAPSSPSYRPVYAGDGLTRDTAYHQGTVWPWLLGAYGRAHYACFGDLNAIRALLKPLVSHLSEAGAGSISEVFDGAWPHKPGGCIAQAWSVAAVITLHQLAHSGESRRTTTSSTAAD
jgi:predicted glycogen debranching enzyme